MANWAAHIESITGLPVAKRARHSIHFQNSDGSITANFSGKPCHYFEGGLWKPIDTTPIISSDGTWGCAHSPVRIAANGAVSVVGSDYSQRARLITGRNVKLNGDHLVRTFANGEQRLYITEDGFRSEITLNSKPNLLQALYLLANVSGRLPDGYVQHPTTMTDAEGAEYTYDTAVNFKAFLEGAKYPVVIDPDFGSPTDYSMAVASAVDYATARASNPWFLSNNPATYGNIFGNYKDGASFRGQRALLKIDTSSIGAGSTVTQVNLKLTATGDRTGISLYVVNYDWSAYDPVVSGNKQAAYGGMTGETGEQGFTQVLTSGTTSSNLTTALVNKVGTTYFGITGAQDYGETETPDATSVGIAACGNANESYRPVLTVTYTAGGVPKQFMHYQRMRSL